MCVCVCVCVSAASSAAAGTMAAARRSPEQPLDRPAPLDIAATNCTCEVSDTMSSSSGSGAIGCVSSVGAVDRASGCDVAGDTCSSSGVDLDRPAARQTAAAAPSAASATLDLPASPSGSNVTIDDMFIKLENCAD